VNYLGVKPNNKIMPIDQVILLDKMHLLRGCVGCWMPSHGNSGNILKDYINGNNGVAAASPNTPTWGSVHGIMGAKYDDTDYHTITSAPKIESISRLTAFSLYYRTDEVLPCIIVQKTHAFQMRVGHSSNNYCPTFEYLGWTSASWGAAYWYFDGAGHYQVRANTEWVSYAVTYDNGSTANDPKGYVNGVDQGAPTENSAPAGSLAGDVGDKMLFGYDGGSESLDGYLGAFLLYNTIISVAMIRELDRILRRPVLT
jgi:hypothetical protein